MSLFEKGAYSPEEVFVGLHNFEVAFSDPKFIRSAQNMILLIVVVTMITFGFAIVFAGILTREKIKGQNIFRIIFYVPNILSVVVIAGVFSAIYKPENGMLNSIIGLFKQDMSTNPILRKGQDLVVVSLIIAMVWQAIGYYMVMYMASMSAVPESLYESSCLDGATRIQQFFQITIPLIWTNIRTTLTFFVISTINMAFLFVRALTSGGPNGASDVALNYMYSQKDAGLYGYSMAIGVIIFLFSFMLSALVNKVTKRDVLEY
jgi:N-acetylglucosamine transport system permease protein